MTSKLEERLKVEKMFHDKKYSDGEAFPHHYKFHPTWPIFEAMVEKLGNINESNILEIGCGTGWITAELASLGGYIDAFDISSEAIEKARKLLVSLNIQDRCNLKIMNGESLDYVDDTFDIVLGFAIIHHLDLSKALTEIYRVLKPGGKAYFAEPLGSNPIINIYRKYTPAYRTPDEKPLRFSDFDFIRNKYANIKHDEYYFFALLSFIFLYVPFLGNLFPFFSKNLMKLDSLFLRRFPFWGKYAWYTIVELQK